MASASTSFSIKRGNGFESFGHPDQGFYSRNLGSVPAPPRNSYISDEPCIAVWYEHGVSSSTEFKALSLELSGGSLFTPFDNALKLSRDPVAYPRARRALCEKLVGLVSSRPNVISTWRQFVSALRNFLSKRSDADSTFYFLSTFLAGEERAEDRAQRRSAFSEFMRKLDMHFAPASTSEAAELLLERAKSSVLTPSRTVSALLEERLRAVDLAGTHSQIGLYEYVRGAFSEVVENLQKPDVTGLQGMLRQVEVDFDQNQNNLTGGSRAEAERFIAKLRAFEVSRTGRDVLKRYWLERAVSSTSSPAGKSATPGPRQAGRPDGTGRGAFPLVMDHSSTHVLVPYTSQETPEYHGGDVFITQVDGGRRVPFLLRLCLSANASLTKAF